MRKGVVMEGRDIGTVVFPGAELKVFMSASAEVRARRRRAELLAKGQEVTLEEVLVNLQERDRKDGSRADSPLRKAEDAFEIDTSELTFDEQVGRAYVLAQKVIGGESAA